MSKEEDEQSCIRILIILNTISVVISILPFLVIPLFKSNETYEVLLKNDYMIFRIICIFIAVLCLTYLLLFRFVQYNYYLIGGYSILILGELVFLLFQVSDLCHFYCAFKNIDNMLAGTIPVNYQKIDEFEEYLLDNLDSDRWNILYKDIQCCGLFNRTDLFSVTPGFEGSGCAIEQPPHIISALTSAATSERCSTFPQPCGCYYLDSVTVALDYEVIIAYVNALSLAFTFLYSLYYLTCFRFILDVKYNKQLPASKDSANPSTDTSVASPKQEQEQVQECGSPTNQNELNQQTKQASCPSQTAQASFAPPSQPDPSSTTSTLEEPLLKQ